VADIGDVVGAGATIGAAAAAEPDGVTGIAAVFAGSMAATTGAGDGVATSAAFSGAVIGGIGVGVADVVGFRASAVFIMRPPATANPTSNNSNATRKPLTPRLAICEPSRYADDSACETLLEASTYARDGRAAMEATTGAAGDCETEVGGRDTGPDDTAV
jgi:hypothetical protein